MPTIPQAPDTTAPSGNPRPEPPHLSRRQFVARNMALLGTVILTQGNEEANNLEVTHHRIAMPHLRAPTRLVQLTDLHRSWCVSEGFIARIVTQTNALHPDLILLTGDFVTGSSRFVYSCVKQLGRLHAPLGMYGVLGNHDYWCDNNQGALAVAESLETVDIRLLMNTSTRLPNGLRLVGVDDCQAGHPDPAAAFSQAQPGEPLLAMTHNPNLFPRLCRFDCVTLAGHTHGGQVNIPYVTSDILGSRTRYLRGWYQHPGLPGRLYVSRGLGVIHVPIRINSCPEIAVLDLVPA